MIHKVLNRCLVVEFYKQNAAFFGLLLLIFFGFIKSSEHLAIGAFIVSNPSALLILFVLWIIYLVKVLFFIIPAIQLRQNRFLEVFLLFPRSKQIISAMLSAALLLLPILLYAVFLFSLSIGGSYWASTLLLATLAMTVTATLCSVLIVKLRQMRKEASYFHIRFLNELTKPYYLFFIEHLMRNDIVLLLLSKLYSCAMIIGTAVLYKTDTFDIRLMTTGVLLALVGNVAILHKYVWFHFHKMAFTRNLPFSLLRMSLHQWLIIALLILPELLLMLRHYPLAFNVFDILGLLLFGFGVAALTYAMLIIEQKDLSRAIVSLFWLITVGTIIILFSVHPLILAIIAILISFAIMYLRYDDFEYVE